jgi:hypothetical protein
MKKFTVLVVGLILCLVTQVFFAGGSEAWTEEDSARYRKGLSKYGNPNHMNGVLDWLEKQHKAFPNLGPWSECIDQCRRVYFYYGDPHDEEKIRAITSKRLGCEDKCDQKYDRPR